MHSQKHREPGHPPIVGYDRNLGFPIRNNYETIDIPIDIRNTFGDQ